MQRQKLPIRKKQIPKRQGQESMEIEKKFQIKRLPEHLEQYPKKEIEQGYLCIHPVVRIRKSNEEYILTYKARAQAAVKDMHINREVEVSLTKEGYLHLREKIDHNLIEKTRYLIRLEDGHMAELDRFHGKLEGLCFVEVEFASEQDADSFTPPAWFGENVSKDKRYTNSFLSQCDSLDVFQ